MDYSYCNKQQLETEYQAVLSVYQEYSAKQLKLDMSRGKPAPAQLDLSLGLLQIGEYKDKSGVDTRNYGNLEGTPEAREWFAELMGTKPQEVIVGGNSSLQLMYTAIELACRKGFADSPAPWGQCEKRKFLCPVPGYDRHFRITEEFGFELIAVPMTPDGPDMDIVEKLVQDESVKGIWTIPVYSNPDGYVYSDETVRRLASMKTAAPDFRIFLDNAYFAHHLTDEKLSCTNVLDACRASGNSNRVLMFCSTSKITFAGAGIGVMAADIANVDAMMKHLFVMTISFDKISQLRHVRFIQKQGGLDAHMNLHAAMLKPKFDLIYSILHEELDSFTGLANWTEPKGGYFLSFFAPKGTARRIVELCKQAGVVLTGAGAAYPYGIDPDDSHIRIAPTFPPIAELEPAARLLCIATRLAMLEKQLAE